MSKAMLLAVKDVKVILSDKGNIFWVLGFPVIFALFFGAIYSGMGEGPRGMKIAVADEDGSEFSRAYVSKLESNESLTVFRFERKEAIDRVRLGKVTAAVLIKPGFGEGFGAIFDSSDPKLEIAADPGQKMGSGYLQGLLAKAQFEALSSRFADRSWMRGQIDTWREDVSGATGLEKRVLNQMARELLLAQSSDWAFIMKSGTFSEYAEKRVTDHIGRFLMLHDQLRGDNIDIEILSESETRHNVFENIDYGVYVSN